MYPHQCLSVTHVLATTCPPSVLISHHNQTHIKPPSHLPLSLSLSLSQRKDHARNLERELRSKQHSVSCLTGDLEPHERDVVMKRFRDGESRVLIATNVLSRGIDILQVCGLGLLVVHTH